MAHRGKGEGWLGLAALSAVILLSATPAAAQLPPSEPWTSRSQEILEEIDAGKWKRAERDARKLGRMLMDAVDESTSSPTAFAMVAAWRAVALAELGRTEEAEWSWLCAHALDPEVPGLDFGRPRPSLEKLRALRPDVGELGTEPLDPRIVPPKLLARETPTFSGSQARKGTVRIFAIVESSGRMRGPILVRGTAGSAAKWYAAMDSVGRWKYEPGTLDGKPIAVPIQVVVNFDVK